MSIIAGFCEGIAGAVALAALMIMLMIILYVLVTFWFWLLLALTVLLLVGLLSGRSMGKTMFKAFLEAAFWKTLLYVEIGALWLNVFTPDGTYLIVFASAAAISYIGYVYYRYSKIKAAG